MHPMGGSTKSVVIFSDASVHISRVNNLDHNTGVENEINQVMSLTKGTSSTIRVPLTHHNFIEICVGSENVVTRALVDTGAQVCVIRRDLWDTLKTPLLENDRSFKTASGTPVNILGKTIVTIRLMRQQLKVPCYVTDRLNHKVILGGDFLREHEAIIDYRGAQRNTIKGHYKLVLPKRCKLTPESDTVVVVEVVGEVPDSLKGTIEGSGKLCRMGILAAKVLTCPETNRVLLSLRNPSAQSISLHKGTHVGQIQTHSEGVQISNIDDHHKLNEITTPHECENVNNMHVHKTVTENKPDVDKQTPT